MNFRRVAALVYRYGLLAKHDLGKILDTFYWPLIDIFSWGFLTLYLNQTQTFTNNFALTLLAGIILWTLVYMLGRDVAISFLDDMWDRNIMNLYGSPLKPSEFLFASFLVAVVRVVIAIAVLALVAFWLFSFNIFVLGFYFALAFLILIVFSFAVGIFATTLILRFGQGVEIFAWSIPALLSPISAVFYPFSVLPPIAQYIALLFPTPYIFEGMRAVLLQGELNWQGLAVASFLDILYLVGAFTLFFWVFDQVRRNGTIARFS